MTDHLIVYHYCKTEDHAANCRLAEVMPDPPAKAEEGFDRLWELRVLPRHLEPTASGGYLVHWPLAMSYRPSVKLASQALFDELNSADVQFENLLAVPA